MSDRAKSRILRLSQFGIVEMTRQRMRPSLQRSNYMDCPHCKGAGMVKNPETASLDILRQIRSVLENERVTTVEVTVSTDVAEYLMNDRRGFLWQMEQSSGKSIVLHVNTTFSNDEHECFMRDNRGALQPVMQDKSLPKQQPNDNGNGNGGGRKRRRR